jgi:hypothetical protein
MRPAKNEPTIVRYNLIQICFFNCKLSSKKKCVSGHAGLTRTGAAAIFLKRKTVLEKWLAIHAAKDRWVDYGGGRNTIVSLLAHATAVLSVARTPTSKACRKLIAVSLKSRKIFLPKHGERIRNSEILTNSPQ